MRTHLQTHMSAISGSYARAIASNSRNFAIYIIVFQILMDSDDITHGWAAFAGGLEARVRLAARFRSAATESEISSISAAAGGRKVPGQLVALLLTVNGQDLDDSDDAQPIFEHTYFLIDAGTIVKAYRDTHLSWSAAVAMKKATEGGAGAGSSSAKSTPMMEAWLSTQHVKVSASNKEENRLGWNPDWIPFASNGIGDYLCVDCGVNDG